MLGWALFQLIFVGTEVVFSVVKKAHADAVEEDAGHDEPVELDRADEPHGISSEGTPVVKLAAK